MDPVNTFYENLLQPFDIPNIIIRDGNQNRYFVRTLSDAGNRELKILMEYESNNTCGNKRSWVGAYYGILHEGKNMGLNEKEKTFVHNYFYESFWKLHHPGEPFINIFIPGDENNNENEHWDFWIRVRENCIDEVPAAILALEEAVRLLNFK